MKTLDRQGRVHGLEVEYHPIPGRVSWCAEWVHGQMQGLAMQFDARGRPITVTSFVRGRGVDLSSAAAAP